MSSQVKAVIIFGYLVFLTLFSLIFRSTLLTWPNGIIVGNLLASAYWAPIGLFHLDHLARKHHRENIAEHRKWRIHDKKET